MKLFNKEKLDTTDYSALPLSKIATIIKVDWEEINDEKNSYGLEMANAMQELNSIEDDYYLDPGIRVVFGFLEFSKNWRTYKSKRIKADLKRRIEELNKKLKKQ